MKTVDMILWTGNAAVPMVEAVVALVLVDQLIAKYTQSEADLDNLFNGGFLIKMGDDRRNVTSNLNLFTLLSINYTLAL